MPHIQQDLTWTDSPPNGTWSCRLAMTCSPRRPAARAVVSARTVGLPTVIGVPPASRSSSGSPTLMHTRPLHLGERVPRQVSLPWEQGYRLRRSDVTAAGSARPVPCSYHLATCHLAHLPAVKRAGSPSPGSNLLPS